VRFDGRGTRGMISLAFPAEIEAVLRDKLKKPELVLSGYFDLIGGTVMQQNSAPCLMLLRSYCQLVCEYSRKLPQ